ncbi:MAG: hypothetical protein EBU54_14875 [Mycobacteriaceae bacterium]|nr:hypothetical protein [Mycobacteriaceae bacterium]
MKDNAARVGLVLSTFVMFVIVPHCWLTFGMMFWLPSTSTMLTQIGFVEHSESYDFPPGVGWYHFHGL